MAVIQDGQQHADVEDWPKFSGIWLLLQVSFLNSRVMIVIFVLFW